MNLNLLTYFDFLIMNTKNRLTTNKTKKYSKDLPLLQQYKTSTLQEHTNKIEQKLNLLKEKIQQKKKTKQIQQKHTLKSELQTELDNFLSKIGMIVYKQKLINNHIDSFQILSEATQKQLQQLAIPKGHCIKIITNVQKHLKAKAKIQENRKQQQEKPYKQYRQVNTKESDRVQLLQKLPHKQVQSICIGQQSIPLQTKKSYFCLFCYKKSYDLFCSQNCSQNYNMMFKKYENNLETAQRNFKKDKKGEQSQKQQNEQQEEQNEENQIVQNFDFLGNEYLQVQDFDYQAYEELKKQLQ